MKNKILYSMIGLLAVGMYSCQKPEVPYSNTAGQGLNSISAMFATGEFKKDETVVFSQIVDHTAEEILISVPYFWPLASDNIVAISEMRLFANMAHNCHIEPQLSGIYDLSKKHNFTFTNANGVKTNFHVTGVIKELDLKSIMDFEIPALGINGVIEEGSKKITLIALDPILDGVASVTLSPHATISPDPATPRSYENPVEFTVTAHDGTTAVYSVQRGVPSKIDKGYRAGSEKELWSYNLNADGIHAKADRNMSLAALGNNLVLNLGNEQIYFNVITGLKVGAITGSRDLGKGSITSDKAGNMLMCNEALDGGSFTIYTTNSVDIAPTILLTYNNASGGSLGKRISVQGDIKTNATITVPLYAASPISNFMRWEIKNGVIGSATWTHINGAGAWGGNLNGDVVSLTPDPADGYLTIFYSVNTLSYIDGATNTLSASYKVPGTAWDSNMNLCTVDAISFNNARYAAVYAGRHFGWGGGYRPFLFDVTTFDNFGAGSLIYNPEQRSFASQGVYAYSDVILWKSADEFKMRMFCVDSNSEALTAYEFNSIAQ